MEHGLTGAGSVVGSRWLWNIRESSAERLGLKDADVGVLADGPFNVTQDSQ